MNSKKTFFTRRHILLPAIGIILIVLFVIAFDSRLLKGFDEYKKQTRMLLPIKKSWR